MRTIRHWNSELGRMVDGPAPARGQTSANIMPDIEPFVSPIDKSVIGTRPQLEAHNKRHNVTNSADFSPKYVADRGKRRLEAQQKEGKQQRIKAMLRYLDQRR